MLLENVDLGKCTVSAKANLECKQLQSKNSCKKKFLLLGNFYLYWQKTKFKSYKKVKESQSVWRYRFSSAKKKGKNRLWGMLKFILTDFDVFPPLQKQYYLSFLFLNFSFWITFFPVKSTFFMHWKSEEKKLKIWIILFLSYIIDQISMILRLYLFDTQELEIFKKLISFKSSNLIYKTKDVYYFLKKKTKVCL